MGNILTENDLSPLQKYRLKPETGQSFNVAKLMDKTFALDFMRNLAYSIGSPSERAAASIFIKRYAFIAVISLFAMTAANKKLNLSLENIEMEEAERGKDWIPMISLKDTSIQEWNGQDRDEWREGVYRDLFANNIYPIIEHFEKTFKVSKLILWENIAVYLFWLYETELKESENPTVLSDFRFLIMEAKGNLFGEYNLNPIKKYYSKKNPPDEIRMRKTCCFTYQLGCKRCKTCPCTHISNDGVCFDGESICGAVQSFT
ncbi:siderophore-iron reductase FhuF [Bacillus niacini]|uniref:Siderophore-iron reductase FhuF n=1 Tax=Neobacillus niacini TaxID=86668 RepID=A0A852T4W7_9BACI|nr:IucA/IucC family C-terminal-domain containing protein [Neobacillus niacini]NYE03742.1 siderophore-iron reductase FhuF [Neobacillus niacini]